MDLDRIIKSMNDFGIDILVTLILSVCPTCNIFVYFLFLHQSLIVVNVDPLSPWLCFISEFYSFDAIICGDYFPSFFFKDVLLMYENKTDPWRIRTVLQLHWIY